MQLSAAYAATLAAVREVFPGAMIAGGALRDLDNDRPVKDLDIFAPDVSCFDDLHGRMAHCAPEGHRILQVMGSYEEWGTQECVGVLDMDCPHGPYQLIGLTTGPETIIPRLDFGICQIGHTGSELIVTPAYLRDKEAQTFTLTRCDDDRQRDRSIRRHSRLSEKYPSWRLVDPEDPFSLIH